MDTSKIVLSRWNISPLLMFSGMIIGFGFTCDIRGAVAEHDSTFPIVGEFVETLQPTRPVSGDLIAGFSGPGQGSVQPPRIEAWVPEQWSNSSICAMVRSRDGRYEAYQSYSVPEQWQSGFHVFTFDEARENNFLRKEISQLATTVYLGNCGTDTDETTVAYWGGRDPESDSSSVIYLNSRRAQEASIYFFGDNTELLCQSIDAADRQVFDFSCTMGNKRGAQRIEINRIRKGNYDDAVDHILHLPDRQP